MGLSQFTINLLSVLLLTLLHLLLALSILRRHSVAVRTVGASIALCVGLLLLDGPFFVIQVLYKTWHPEYVDRVWAIIWFPWFLLQVNVLLYATYRGIRYLMKKIFRHDVRHSPTDMKNNTLRKNMASVTDSVAREERPPRRRFIQSAALALGGVAVNATILRGANGDEDVIVERIKIKVPNLPESFRGLRIGMISDIHSNDFMTRERMKLYARGLNALKADLIVIPGDFVHNRVKQVYPFAEAFSELTAPLGVYGVTGNHDYYARDIDRVVREVEDAGIQVLINENVRLTRGSDSIRLLGVDEDAIYDVKEYLARTDTSRGAIDHMMTGVAHDETKILLCHKPYPFEQYAELGVDLMLSGHTHGGQIVLAGTERRTMNVSIASLASTYLAGHYRSVHRPEAQMYISRGIGTTGIPIRINCPPEITHIMLV